MRLFGIILSVVLVVSIFALIGTAAALDNDSASRLAGKQTVWIAITASVGWHWIRTIWRPFDVNSADQLSVTKSQGFMGLKFGDNAKSSDQNRITQETHSTNFLGLKLGRSAKQAPYEGRTVQSSKPQWMDPTKEPPSNKSAKPQSLGQKEPREFDFDKTSRMFISKGSRSVKSKKESVPTGEGSFPKDQLQELKTVFDQGLIDADEYSALKKANPRFIRNPQSKKLLYHMSFKRQRRRQ